MLACIVDANTGRSSTVVATNSSFHSLFGFVATEIALQDSIGDALLQWVPLRLLQFRDSRFTLILITGASSGLVETITDAVSIHSIKKSKYARWLAEGRFGYVTLLDHFKSTYGGPSMAKFVQAQCNFVKSLAGFEAAPFKLPPEYVGVLGGVDGESFLEFKCLFREGFEAARKHCDRIIILVELMQKDCGFAA
ncbi:hypothetical protein EV424DRAFT_1351689 [Suillus variegatus]|nr:hypothetical protein EV424DRAFT_1351689 [Suillus variegatus]